MCEYCGCQALASIAQLTAEHDEIVTLIGRARKAVTAGDVASAATHAGSIVRLLGPHTAVEEEGLFPALRDEFPDHVESLLAEHRAVEAVLAEADDPPSGWLERLATALHQLRLHILTEQDGAFPAALGSLDPDDWDRVDGVRARVGSALLTERAPGVV